MEINKIVIVGLFTTMMVTSVVLFNHSSDKTTIEKISSCKEDSLQSVVNDLQTQLEIQEDGFDKKEQRYEDILFEYEFGLERLRETHPSAYKEFHRIIAFKDRYRLEDERENNKRLNYNKW